MTYAEISESVEKLKRKYCETDPFRLCKELGIKLLYQSLETHPNAIKGFFLESKRIRTITINSDLPRTYRQYFSRFLKRYNLPKVKFHEIRHTFAVRAIEIPDLILNPCLKSWGIKMCRLRSMSMEAPIYSR